MACLYRFSPSNHALPLDRQRTSARQKRKRSIDCHHVTPSSTQSHFTLAAVSLTSRTQPPPIPPGWDRTYEVDGFFTDTPSDPHTQSTLLRPSTFPFPGIDVVILWSDSREWNQMTDRQTLACVTAMMLTCRGSKGSRVKQLGIITRRLL